MQTERDRNVRHLCVGALFVEDARCLADLTPSTAFASRFTNMHQYMYQQRGHACSHVVGLLVGLYEVRYERPFLFLNITHSILSVYQYLALSLFGTHRMRLSWYCYDIKCLITCVAITFAFYSTCSYTWISCRNGFDELIDPTITT